MAADPAGSHNLASSATRAPRPASRDTFAADELAIVLSHYDIGVIDSIVEFRADAPGAPSCSSSVNRENSSSAPAPRGKDDPFKVAFTHALAAFSGRQASSRCRHLIGTRREIIPCCNAQQRL